MTTTAIDPRELVRDAIAKVSTIATLPEVTGRIVATVEDPRSTAAQLHRIVSHDPALVTRILKVVNSAFYGLPGQVASIERAIVLLGLNAVKNVAVAASLGQLFRGAELCDGFTARDLWTHCISVAVASRALAAQCNPQLANEAFLAGLIHDIGLIVSLQTAPETLRRVCREVMETDADFRTVERRLSGVDHEMLGMALAEQWKFPRTCQLVAGYHHHPVDLADDCRAMAGIVFVADTMCCRIDGAFDLTARNQSPANADPAGFGLDQAGIDRVGAALPELIANASAVFG